MLCCLFSVLAGFSHRRSRSSDGLVERMCSHAHRKVGIHTTKPFHTQDVLTVDRNYTCGTVCLALKALEHWNWRRQTEWQRCVKHTVRFDKPPTGHFSTFPVMVPVKTQFLYVKPEIYLFWSLPLWHSDSPVHAFFQVQQWHQLDALPHRDSHCAAGGSSQSISTDWSQS